MGRNRILNNRIDNSGFIEEEDQKNFDSFNDSRHRSQNSSINLSSRISNASVNEVEKSLKDFQEAVKNKSINIESVDKEDKDKFDSMPETSKIIEEN